MGLKYAVLCAALCIGSGSACYYGPLNSTVKLGVINEPSDKNVRASKNLIGLLEYLRRLMTVGIADTVSPMEPYVRESLYSAVFDNPDSPLRGSVNLSNLVVSGAQGFTINDVSVQTDAKRVEFDIAVPKLVADLDYSAINFVYNNYFVFNVSGHVQIILENFNAVGALAAAPLVLGVGLMDKFYTVSGLHVVNTANDVQTDVEATQLPTEIINEIKDELFNSVAKTAIHELNKVLINFNQKQILQFLVEDHRGASKYLI